MNLEQKVFRLIIPSIFSVYIVGSSMLEGFLYFVIVDDVNQGFIPWKDFWGVSTLTAIRFLVMAVVIFIMYRLGSRTLFILLFSIALFEFIVFLGANHFIFYPPLVSNLLITMICGLIIKKDKGCLVPKGGSN
ncbi:hypothetical protein HN020_12305 [Brevibacillus borstelensis]|uniref:Uncharacterized protein n=1 Tax=Brevibacillus borstelensis AK1 TaxID=1300222 RepID=M8DCB9_9BACL|nr:hypothetical protein [Brevibacillus borstelensis]EMT53949.1 hypothetical protein I532_00045 [Brevibacillus borstelensis AK1]MCM3589363.1 hypothetical protein [Brevibacillus borstelensis]MCM3625582.1 hypothetical protein [Brevibacillus borstelensis]MED1876826.1 hypothetical protein [Brevibacillus borstelensis]NOU55523.1 hypothetical protein [Brevibacillus borstelensis]